MKQIESFSPTTDLFYNSRIHKEIPSDAIEVTKEEYRVLLAGRNAGQRIVLDDGKLVLADLIISQDQLELRERAWRDNQLAGVQWIRDRHRDQVEIGAPPTLAAEQFNELLVYLQALRDWPQSEQFPEVEHRPVAPPWIAEQTQ
ncbi:phage tail assembly chaperone [Pseudomonas mosselii]|uniref:phage tail assembly chaperone n=1 Tax=Pseudomonas mosselii TaxID=78327 RepID=UPI0021A886BC|nr:phage tail assembly chaperone [Pseudomonas mosselii]UWS65376.1 phage tail assembly chaperone [Pseudomonas mosselii]